MLVCFCHISFCLLVSPSLCKEGNSHTNNNKQFPPSSVSFSLVLSWRRLSFAGSQYPGPLCRVSAEGSLFLLHPYLQMPTLGNQKAMPKQVVCQQIMGAALLYS